LPAKEQVKTFSDCFESWDDDSEVEDIVKIQNKVTVEVVEKCEEPFLPPPRKQQRKRSLTPVKPPTKPTRTQMCRSIMQNRGPCTFRRCTFAHSVHELSPKACFFGDRCKHSESTCGFIHCNETKEDFCERLGIPMKEPISHTNPPPKKSSKDVVVDAPKPFLACSGSKQTVFQQIEIGIRQGYSRFKVTIK